MYCSKTQAQGSSAVVPYVHVYRLATPRVWASRGRVSRGVCSRTRLRVRVTPCLRQAGTRRVRERGGFLLVRRQPRGRRGNTTIPTWLPSVRTRRRLLPEVRQCVLAVGSRRHPWRNKSALLIRVATYRDCDNPRAAVEVSALWVVGSTSERRTS